jgi:regulator of sigma E protease
MMKFLQLFLALTILITLHEFGHFWFAKKFKTRVDKFYLFFDFLFPFSGVLNFTLFKKKIGDTEYGIGWFPFGGYVQIAGMVDEQMDKSIIDAPAQPWELRSKPAWQRLLVMMGGIIVNLILGFFIYIMILFVWGKDTLPLSKLKYGIVVDSTAYKMGLRNGDVLLSIDGKEIKSLNRVPIMIIMDKAKSIEINRNGENLIIPVTDDNISKILKNLKKSPFIVARMETEVDSIVANSQANKLGLQKNDKVIAINNVQTNYFDEYRAEIQNTIFKIDSLPMFKSPEVLEKYLSNKGFPSDYGAEYRQMLESKIATSIKVTVLRNNDTIQLSGKINASGVLGFNRKPIQFETEKFGFFGAITQGFSNGVESIVMQAKQFVVIFTVKDAHQQVGGFYTMYQQMPEEWDWHDFWAFTGMLSLVLAFMNFLPIPMLDGGYIMFILFEMITRKKVSDKFIYYANSVGMVIILALMLYANTDFIRNKFM